MRLSRTVLVPAFLVALAWAQFRESGLREIAARLEIQTEPRMPARVYLYKDGRPFRLSPVDALLPLRVDLFYRERLWRRSNDPATLEVTCNNISHFFLLKGAAGFDLPAGKYRIEAYRGLFFKPVSVEFELNAGATETVTLRMENWAGAESASWLSGDDHIHLVRAPEDDALFLKWMDAEDLSVANFLQLQRQMDAAAQYGFGPKAEARIPGRSIRPGHESRSEFFGHVNLLGGRELIRPLSLGTMYANGPETYPYPFVLFGMGRKLGATVGYAHFDGSTKHSALLMDVALGSIDFVEVFQFGSLRTEQWYELLNAGFKVTGVAGSDFPVSLNRSTRAEQWSRWIPLLGPERLLIKANAGESAYEAWARGIRNGEGMVTNGPMIEIDVNQEAGTARARAKFHRVLDSVELVANGRVLASSKGAEVAAKIPSQRPLWLAARADAGLLKAHTNPVYLGWTGEPALPEARQALARRWQDEIGYYRTAPLLFPSEEERTRFFQRAEQALARLKSSHQTP
ncbi:MAG: CehA/McbA family metallohydrolase [Acidobacteria bacterium]|nr:CehA/McbA family metallohydrolase [Acidobacteriota bacterium]